MIRRRKAGAAPGASTPDAGFIRATLLGSGKVLVVGGLTGFLDVVLSSAELYDPTTGTWSSTGSLGTARYEHTATLLP